MSPFVMIACVIIAAWLAFSYGKHVVSRRVKVAGGATRLHTLLRYYGYCAVLWVVVPFILAWHALFVLPLSVRIMLTLLVAAGGVALFLAWARPEYNARHHVEKWIKIVLMACATISIAVTAMIVLSVLGESLRFFEKVPVMDFLFGTHWSPQLAYHDAGAASFGAVPVFVGTLLITCIAMLIAGPMGLFSAIYLCEYASPRVRGWVKPVLEILAGVPTVVYGYFAVIFFAPFIRSFGQSLGLDVASESALAAGIVMGVMIIPFVLSLSDDVLHAVPQSLREASLGLGATQSETITRVLLPAALPGIAGAMLLGVSRAIGETMIVVMAAGLAANLTANPLEAVTTVTVQIVTLLVGDQSFDSAKTLAAFALSLTLFVVTLLLNILALWLVRRYREHYE